MTERMRSQVQPAEMSFLRRVAGLSLRDKMRSLDIQERLRVEPVEVVGASGHISQLAWEHLDVPPEELVEVPGERSAWISLVRLLPL